MAGLPTPQPWFPQMLARNSQNLSLKFPNFHGNSPGLHKAAYYFRTSEGEAGEDLDPNGFGKLPQKMVVFLVSSGKKHISPFLATP